jgi:hypothetical protein
VRLWTLHPRYLDPQGLVALWREGLLAQAVLAGKTRGYRAHPQLERFRAGPDPLAAIGAFLLAVRDEAQARGYAFDASRILHAERARRRIPATVGQLRFEARHLKAKLSRRSPRHLRGLALRHPEPHPLFRAVPGAVEPWERAAPARREDRTSRARGATHTASPQRAVRRRTQGERSSPRPPLPR